MVSQNGKIILAKLSCFCEQLWVLLLWPMMVIMITISLGASGVLSLMPSMLASAILLLCSVLFVISLSQLRSIKWPKSPQAIRRIESASNLTHRPLSSADDRIARELSDHPQTIALWNEHKSRQSQRINNLKIGIPRSKLSAADPLAFRFAAGLLLVVSLVIGRDSPINLFSYPSMGWFPSSTSTPQIDAWVTPPSLTKQPPFILTSPALLKKAKDKSSIDVPYGSKLTLIIKNASALSVKFGTNLIPTTTPENFTADIKLDKSTALEINDHRRLITSWMFNIINDKPPAISFLNDPEIQGPGGLLIKWIAEDDYGITNINATLSLADEQKDGTGFGSNGPFLVESPKFPLQLRKAYPKLEEGKTVADLTAHPWAGLMVDMVLTAQDATGQTGQTMVKNFKLPEYPFRNPLAQALIEQRKALLLNPDETTKPYQLLEALISSPQSPFKNSGLHLNLYQAINRLKDARAWEEVFAATELLWKIALNLEAGNTNSALEALSRLRHDLEKILLEGASPQKTEELMAQLRAVTKQYLQEMSKLSKRIPQSNSARNQNNMISPHDLKKMLDKIEGLIQIGASDAANQLLAQFDDIMRNLQPRHGDSQAEMQQKGREGKDGFSSQFLKSLSEVIRQQQNLMDQTQRQFNQENEYSNIEKNKSSVQNIQKLSDQQNQLRNKLTDLGQKLTQKNIHFPDSFTEASAGMHLANQALTDQNAAEALRQQNETMHYLGKGMREMIKKLAPDGQQNGSSPEENSETYDPLGRLRQYGTNQNIMPSESATARARALLEYLRNRANKPDLNNEDQLYIKRLLRGLYL